MWHMRNGINVMEYFKPYKHSSDSEFLSKGHSTLFNCFLHHTETSGFDNDDGLDERATDVSVLHYFTKTGRQLIGADGCRHQSICWPHPFFIIMKQGKVNERT